MDEQNGKNIYTFKEVLKLAKKVGKSEKELMRDIMEGRLIARVKHPVTRNLVPLKILGIKEDGSLEYEFLQ
jgi:hypothetical protein